MAFDLNLADRVRQILKDEILVEKKMFGGIGYLIRGNMACGVHGDKLIVRVGKERYEECLARPSVKPFDLTGSAMTGWVEVLPSATQNEKTLEDWVHLGVEYAQTLPSKQG